MKPKSPDPQLYIRTGLEGTRARFLVAAKDINAEVFTMPEEEIGVFPMLVDKDVAVSGRVMDEYIHERWPGPCLLTGDPAFRARLRTLESSVIGWYSEIRQAEFLRTAADALDPNTPFFCGIQLSVVDIALAPLLEAVPLGHFARSFQVYGSRIVATMYQATKGQRVDARY